MPRKRNPRVKRILNPKLALKVAILTAGKTQRTIATKACIHESRLSNIIKGKDEPNPREREKLATALERPESDLFPA